MQRTFGISAIALALTGADAGSCKPVKMIQTRASGSPGEYDEATKKWSTKYGLSTVNTASLSGSLYYVIAETIDKSTGYDPDECTRKNGVQYIHFYEVTYCNPDAALEYFNKGKYNLGEYGQYLTFDGGVCNQDQKYCKALTGEGGEKKLGQYVGWQDQSDAKRNPTKGSYWYSLPGECPNFSWADKTDECKEKYPTGACKEGETPDGEKCTWSYKLLGQVNLDELVGITDLKNAAGKHYKNATEFCKDKKVEFLRDPNTFDKKEGLPFWDKPLDEKANADRVQKLLKFYGEQENNLPLPSAADLKKNNPRCYESAPGCFDADTKKETCARNDDMRCVPCDQVEGGCTGEVDPSKAMKIKGNPTVKTDGSAGSGSDGSAASRIALSAMLVGMTLLVLAQ